MSECLKSETLGLSNAALWSHVDGTSTSWGSVSVVHVRPLQTMTLPMHDYCSSVWADSNGFFQALQASLRKHCSTESNTSCNVYIDIYTYIYTIYNGHCFKDKAWNCQFHVFPGWVCVTLTPRVIYYWSGPQSGQFAICYWLLFIITVCRLFCLCSISCCIF